jgi:hypothetical protein
MATKRKLGIIKDSPVTEMTLGRELSEREYAEYLEASAGLVRFVDDQQQFNLVRESFGEYKILVERYAQKYARRPRLNHAVQGEISNRVNSKLRNFFSEFRAFLDYTETHLKTCYGEHSKEFKDFKAACSREYDSNVSYRFVYKLRSYAQHSDVPINNVSIESGDFDPALDEVRHHLLLEIDRYSLLNTSFNWTAKVRSDIEWFPPRFELDSHIMNMLLGLERINVATVVAALPALKQNAEVIVNLVEPLRGDRGTPAIVGFDPPVHARGETVRGDMSIGWIPIDVAKFVLRLPEPTELAKNEMFVVNFKSPS